MVVDMVTIFIHYIFKLPSIYGILLLDIMNKDLKSDVLKMLDEK